MEKIQFQRAILKEIQKFRKCTQKSFYNCVLCDLLYATIIIHNFLHLSRVDVYWRTGKAFAFCPVLCSSSLTGGDFAFFELFFLDFGGPMGPWVRAPLKNGVSTAPCGTHETPLFRKRTKNYIRSCQWGPADTSGSCSNHLVYAPYSTIIGLKILKNQNSLNWPVEIEKN